MTEFKYKEVRDRLDLIFQANELSLNGLRDHPLQILKRKALKQMEKAPFPNRRNENWKYTSAKPFLNPAYNELESATPTTNFYNSFEALENAIIIEVVNGVPKLESDTIQNLPKGLSILTLQKAYENTIFKAFIDEKLTNLIQDSKNSFELLNIAFAKYGLFIHVEKNVEITQPIVFNYSIETDKTAFFYHPQILIKAEQGSKLSFIENFSAAETDSSISDEQSGFSNSLHFVQVGQNATVKQYKLQNESQSNNHLFQIHAFQEKDSQFYSHQLDIGGGTVRNNVNVHLIGSNTETHLLGNYIGSDKQSIDNQTFIDHAEPHCFSNELYKGVVTDRAKAVFNGQVMVRQDAQKTNAFQQNASLVLSPYAIVNAKPQLEIYADDVKCSHGATIGQLDNEAIFYLKTRGLSDQAAREMLQLAFVNEVIDQYEDKEIAALFTNAMTQKLTDTFSKNHS